MISISRSQENAISIHTYPHREPYRKAFSGRFLRTMKYSGMIEHHAANDQLRGGKEVAKNIADIIVMIKSNRPFFLLTNHASLLDIFSFFSMEGIIVSFCLIAKKNARMNRAFWE
jgi:hypothetical protein